MTTLERQAVRQGIIDAGFTRIASTPDNGDGQYTETWASKKQENTIIRITWDKKTYDVPTELANIVTAFENAANGAVGYVGAANYAERETEARVKVEHAAKLALSRLKALFGKINK